MAICTAPTTSEQAATVVAALRFYAKALAAWAQCPTASAADRDAAAVELACVDALMAA